MLNIKPNVKQSKENQEIKVSDFPFMFSENLKTCKDLFHKHDLKKDIHFWNQSHFSLHDLIIYFANRKGPVHLIASSFNLSERAAKNLLQAQQKGAFHTVKLVLNKQKSWSFSDAAKLLENYASIKYYKNHSKVACLWNDTFYCSIVYTGNLSNNKNLERGFISFKKDIFKYDYNRLSEIFNQ